MEPTTTASGCEVIGHQLVKEVVYTTRKCSLCKIRCLFRTRKMVKCVACKCVMHKRCLIAVAGDLILIAPPGETAVPVTGGDDLVAGVPEDEDAHEAGGRGPHRDAGYRGPAAEAVRNGDGQGLVEARDDDGDDQGLVEAKDDGDDQGSVEARDDDGDDRGFEEEWDENDTVWLSTKLTWMGNKDARTVVVMAKIELKLREKRHATSVTWEVQRRLWDQWIGQTDADPRGYVPHWDDDDDCTVAVRVASGDERKTSLLQRAFPVAATLVHGCGYTAKTAGTVAAAEDGHSRAHGSPTRTMATAAAAPGHRPLWPVDNVVAPRSTVVGPFQSNIRRPADNFSAAAGHRPRFASKFVVPAVPFRPLTGMFGTTPMLPLAIVKTPPPPPPRELSTAFDFLMSVWGPLSSKEKELQAYVQRPKIALAPFVVVQSKLAESNHMKLSESRKSKNRDPQI